MSDDDDIKNFVKFMKNHIISKDDKTTIITHTLMGKLHENYAPFKGKFKIDDIDNEEFMDLYGKAINKMNMHIVERPKKIGPMIIDIDFKTNYKHKERQYLTEHIELIIKKYNKLFMQYLAIPKINVKAFVFEKPDPTYDEKKKEYKDGFHILYPDVPLSVEKRYFFFDKVKSEIIEENSFSNIPFTNEYEDILDASVLNNNGILMYGSCKEGRKPYSLTRIYNNDMTIDSIDNYDQDYEMIDYFSIRKYSDDDDTDFYENNDDCIANDIYNSYSGGNKKKSIERFAQESSFDIDEDDKKIKTKYHDLDEEKTNTQKKADINTAKSLVKLLSEKRARIYIDWIHVGWTLYNISPSLLPSFIEFSKKCPEKYESGCCEKIWESACTRNDGYSIASLHWWARNDNNEGYVIMLREKAEQLLYKIDSGTHDDIANVVTEMYRHIYKCVNISKNVWLEYQNNKWVAIDNAYTLKERISSEITKDCFSVLTSQCNDAANKVSLAQDDSMRKAKNVLKTCEKLKTSTFIKCVVEQCSHKMYDNKFEEKLNTNPYLIGFENGVYDLKNQCFRRGVPDDMISMTTGYDYKDFSDNANEIKEIEKYFSQVQQDEDMREYILRLMASFFDGRVIDQKFVVWTGSGCHAKDEEIKMYNNTIKKIQNIKIGDYVLGGDGRQRKVLATFSGIEKMCNIISEKNKIFKITISHRLAVRSHFKPLITKDFDDIFDKDIYWVTYHELLNNVPTEIIEKFYTIEDCTKFINKLPENETFISYSDILPIKVNDLYYIKEDVKKYYKLVKYNEKCIDNTMDLDETFTIEQLNNDSFFGIELDGDKRYVMANEFITYNSNGKSTTIDLIHNTLGEYAGILPVTILTKKRGSSGAAVPELADKKGKRFLAIQEPEHDDVIYVGLMKELTAGNDKIHARALYGNPFTYKPQFKLILTCNKLPEIPASDGGTWRRLRVTPWESEFVDKPVEKHQFKKDTNLQEKMEKWGQPFAWLLLTKYYPKYKTHGLEEPPKVTKYTNEYKKNSDIYCEFLTEFVTDTPGSDGEKIDYLFELFKKWHKEAYQSKVPPKKEFVGYLTKKKYVIENKIVKNITTVHINEY